MEYRITMMLDGVGTADAEGLLADLQRIAPENGPVLSTFTDRPHTTDVTVALDAGDAAVAVVEAAQLLARAWGNRAATIVGIEAERVDEAWEG
ncbi:MAG: hypothetical protein KIT14_22570 [bacterium]|nr:hypothetical protein [bacterium]